MIVLRILRLLIEESVVYFVRFGGLLLAFSPSRTTLTSELWFILLNNILMILVVILLLI